MKEMEDGTFVALDVIAIRGFSTRDKPFKERLDVLREACDEPKMASLMTLRPKQWVPVRDIERLRMEAHAQDGIIFCNSRLPYINNRNLTMYKWKSSHTVDLYVENGKSYVNTHSGKLKRVNYKMSKDLVSGVYECEVDGEVAKVIKRRPYRKQPNQENVLIATLELKPISYEDLLYTIL